MKRAQSVIRLAYASLLIASLPAVNAQSAEIDVDRVLGNWSFQSVPYRDDTCQMSGSMQIRPTPDTGKLACRFTAIEACIGEDRWIVEQICSVDHNGSQLSLRSSITNFIESDSFTGSYMPDHFVLTIESAGRMRGQIISSISAGVEFTRQEEAVS